MTIRIHALCALTLAASLAACGEPIDGGDTADLSSDATEAQTGPTDGPTYEPGEGGPLNADIYSEEDPTADGSDIDEESPSN